MQIRIYSFHPFLLPFYFSSSLFFFLFSFCSFFATPWAAAGEVERGVGGGEHPIDGAERQWRASARLGHFPPAEHQEDWRREAKRKKRKEKKKKK